MHGHGSAHDMSTIIEKHVQRFWVELGSRAPQGSDIFTTRHPPHLALFCRVILIVCVLLRLLAVAELLLASGRLSRVAQLSVLQSPMTLAAPTPAAALRIARALELGLRSLSALESVALQGPPRLLDALRLLFPGSTTKS